MNIHSTPEPTGSHPAPPPALGPVTVRRGLALTAAIGLLTAAVLAGCGGKSGGGASPSPAGPTGRTATPQVPTPPATGSPAPGAPGTAAPQGMLPTGYQPLWPFSSAAEVAAWQASYRSGGHQPWHLSADQTALAFTQGFLGFKEVGTVITRSVKGSDARITVGYQTPENSRPAPAAVLHLIRAGSGRDAPWEVVGTDDKTLTLTTPAYGATVTPPLTVGGRITGVDESIQLRVLRAGAGSPLGSYCCLAAGGQNSPWSAKVSFGAGTGRILTIVAWTGGHVASVERFAVTGVRG